MALQLNRDCSWWAMKSSQLRPSKAAQSDDRPSREVRFMCVFWTVHSCCHSILPPSEWKLATFTTRHPYTSTILKQIFVPVRAARSCQVFESRNRDTWQHPPFKLNQLPLYHYPNFTVVIPSVCPESITRHYLTEVKKSLSLNLWALQKQSIETAI